MNLINLKMGFQGRGENEKVRDDMLILLLFNHHSKNNGRPERSGHIQIKIHISSASSEGVKLNIDD